MPFRRPPAIRTADVLAAFTTTPQRVADVAKAMGYSSSSLSGHITHLHRQGKLTRVGRGAYVLSSWGEQAQGSAA